MNKFLITLATLVAFSLSGVAYADAIAPSNYDRDKRCSFNVDAVKVKQMLNDLPVHYNFVDMFSRDDVLSQIQ